MNYKMLVNKDNAINKSIMNNLNLVKVRNYFDKDILIERKVYYKYLQLKDFLLEKRIDIEIDSSYRSIEEQTIFYYSDSLEDKPYYSEYHTGFAIDIVVKMDGEYCSNDDSLIGEIHEYLKNFGFILRYPKGKEKITFHKYNPFHIRYVGTRTANIMFRDNLTLEEYSDKYNINGILVVNKPMGITSRDVVDFVSKKFDTKKVGHTGTLDPLASGVLILTIGNATKISEDIMSEDKEYIAEVKMGIRTDTYDVTGNVLEEDEVPSDINIIDTLKTFEKTYMQEVPIYSAVKINGKKLYQYARNNEEVTLPKKSVTIKEIELLEQNKDTFKFRCVVSKGTYIRSLINDMSKSMGVLLSMSNLIRTREYKYTLSDSYTLSDIECDNYKIISIEDVLNYPIVNLDDQTFFKVKNGVTISNRYNINDKVIFKYNDKLIAIYRNVDGVLKSCKNFM